MWCLVDWYITDCFGQACYVCLQGSLKEGNQTTLKTGSASLKPQSNDVYIQNHCKHLIQSLYYTRLTQAVLFTSEQTLPTVTLAISRHTQLVAHFNEKKLSTYEIPLVFGVAAGRMCPPPQSPTQGNTPDNDSVPTALGTILWMDYATYRVRHIHIYLSAH